MRRAKGRECRGNVLELLGIGKGAPKELVRQRMAQVKRNLEARRKEKSGLGQEASKYWSTIEGPIAKVVGGDAQVARAVDGLRGISERVAKRKLVVPKTAGKVPGILAGSLVGRVPAPYDYAFSFTSGDPSSASADKSSGQMSAIAPPTALTGFAYAEMGIYLRPLLPMLVRAWVSPAFAFSWSANSISAATPAESAGDASLQIDCEEGTFGPGSFDSNDYVHWNVNYITRALAFDFGSSAGSLAQVQAFTDPSQSCVLFVNCTVNTFAKGWPGSLASASLAVTVPSITFELVLI